MVTLVRQVPGTVSKVTVAALVVTLTPVAAEAQYLDPGAGSIIVQAVIAVAVGVSATVKLYWHRISPFFNRLRNRDRS